MIAQHPHCVASVNLPAHDLDLHIFSNRMMIATKCDTSPARRKIFMVFMLQQNKVNATPHGPYTSSGDSHSLTHKTQTRGCAGVDREATSCAATVGRLSVRVTLNTDSVDSAHRSVCVPWTDGKTASEEVTWLIAQLFAVKDSIQS